MKNFEAKFSYALSVVFHPVFVPLIITFIIFNLPVYPFIFLNPKAKLLLYSLVFINTAILPVVFTFILYKIGIVKSIEINERKQRTIPLIIAMLMLFFTYLSCLKLNLPQLWYNVLIIQTLIILFALIINFFFKISLHMISWGSIAALVILLSRFFNLDYFLLINLVILISGLVAYARLSLKAHKAEEVFFGFALGFCVMFFGLLIL